MYYFPQMSMSCPGSVHHLNGKQAEDVNIAILVCKRTFVLRHVIKEKINYILSTKADWCRHGQILYKIIMHFHFQMSHWGGSDCKQESWSVSYTPVFITAFSHSFFYPFCVFAFHDRASSPVTSQLPTQGLSKGHKCASSDCQRTSYLPIITAETWRAQEELLMTG